MQAMTNLGNCSDPKCQNKLAVRELPRFRMAGDHRIFLDEHGQDIPLDVRGNPTRKVATRWTVVCLECNRPHPDHPYQKVLDEAVAQRKATPPPTPVFTTDRQFVPASEMEDRIRATATLEARLAALERRHVELLARHEELLARMNEGEEWKRGQPESS